jgi:hypothetical protein
MPARTTEPAVGASTCASGSQVWNGHIGTLTANEANIASHSQNCSSGAYSAAINVGMSVVPSCRYITRIAMKNSTEPSRVYRKNLKAE